MAGYVPVELDSRGSFNETRTSTEAVPTGPLSFRASSIILGFNASQQSMEEVNNRYDSESEDSYLVGAAPEMRLSLAKPSNG